MRYRNWPSSSWFQRTTVWVNLSLLFRLYTLWQKGRRIHARVAVPRRLGWREHGLCPLPVVADLHVPKDPAQLAVDALARQEHVLVVLPDEGFVEHADRIVGAIHVGAPCPRDNDVRVLLKKLVVIGEEDGLRKRVPVRSDRLLVVQRLVRFFEPVEKGIHD